MICCLPRPRDWLRRQISSRANVQPRTVTVTLELAVEISNAGPGDVSQLMI